MNIRQRRATMSGHIEAFKTPRMPPIIYSIFSDSGGTYIRVS